jgi:hypothetical protein
MRNEKKKNNKQYQSLSCETKSLAERKRIQLHKKEFKCEAEKQKWGFKSICTNNHWTDLDLNLDDS